jgi:hypothetical protein
MPYINEAHRKKYEKPLQEIITQLNIDGVSGLYPVGNLNYIISEIVNQTLKRQGLRYQTINAIIGALECCKLELYRKVARPYEDEKCKINGEVYDITQEKRRVHE